MFLRERVLIKERPDMNESLMSNSWMPVTWGIYSWLWQCDEVATDFLWTPSETSVATSNSEVMTEFLAITKYSKMSFTWGGTKLMIT